MPQRNINFSDRQDGFIAQMIEEGIYSNASELVRSAMRRFQEEHERKEQEWAQHLREVGEKALAAVERGEGIDISTPEKRRRVSDEIRGRAKKRAEKYLHDQENS
jgi:putative addiction module CopG family antidote